MKVNERKYLASVYTFKSEGADPSQFGSVVEF